MRSWVEEYLLELGDKVTSMSITQILNGFYDYLRKYDNKKYRSRR